MFCEFWMCCVKCFLAFQLQLVLYDYLIKEASFLSNEQIYEVLLLVETNVLLQMSSLFLLHVFASFG